MDESFVTIATIFLTLVGAGCLYAVYSDLKHDRGRMAHEDGAYSRKELPLNFWLGVLSKGAGAAVAVALIIVLGTAAG
jgi:hypothetical protein